MIARSLQSNAMCTVCCCFVALLAGCGGSQPEPQQPTYQQYPAVGQGQAPGQQGYPAQQQYPQQQYPQQQPAAVPQQYPTQPGPGAQYPQQQQQPPAQYPTTPGQTPPPATGPAPGAALPPTATAGPQALPVDPAAAAALQPLITQAASGSTPAGAKPLGALMAANFQQGQQLTAQIQMEPGRCYTVLAAGTPPSVTEVDLQLVAVSPMAGMAPILAVDNSSGPTAVLGEKPNCYKWAWPIPAPVQVVLTVRGGAGIAAAQVFAK